MDQATTVFSVRDVAKAEAGSGSGSGSGSDSGTGSAAAAEPGDERLRAAVAAWVGTADGKDETDADAAAADTGKRGGAAEAEAPGAADGAESESSAAAEAGAPVDAAAKAADSAEAEPNGAEKPEPADAEDAQPEKAGPADAAPKAASSGAAQAADAEDAVPQKPEPADAEPEKSEPADAAPKVAAAKAAEPKKPEPVDAEPEKSDATPKKPAPAGGTGGDEAGGVDQATAVFKAVAPPVDQPTTMLKAPGVRPAESDAERTSKFVPLKSLDDRGGDKAKPATTATPTPAPTERTAETAVPEPTTQQPLPPKPPLDLLAELTNTPPPPETRVRTTVRRVKIWTPLVLLLIVIFAVVQVVRPLPAPTLELTAKDSVTFEGDKPAVPWPGQGQAAMDVNGIGTFGTSGTQKPVPIASIAKVMTVYLILRDHPLKTGEKGPDIPVDAAAQKHYETGKAERESVVKVSEGQKLSEYEALQAVMLPSANNVAKLLARWDTKSSSEDQFVDKMNKMAKDLGMKNTTYTDPSGLDKTTVSTADDLVKLGRAAMENPVFKEISSQPSYVDLNGDKQKNFFGLVPTVAIGIKTGTTTAAGGNILFAAEKKIDGKTQTIIGAALGQYGRNGTANIDEVTGVVENLIASGQKALTAKTVVKKGDVVGHVDDGLGGTTPVVAAKDVSAVGWSGLTVHLKLDGKKGETLPHTAKAGTVVGVLSVGDGKNDATAVEVPVALQKDLAEPGFGAKLRRLG
ncbi:D-alanyl-D-alanine carboxypeptidase [Streptomyces sp. NPDC046939]|uniref:D-alanyl-D-alanine carboxypeptidase n=1 Tax=Streptomyces sp. NPDC046939 TaxID=3155376 RepID=UPI0033DB98BD